MAQRIVTVNDVLGGRVVLDIECLDRVYLNAYVPVLQSSGQVVAFMTQHLGMPIPSPALMEKISTRFRSSVESFAEANGIPWVRFGKDDRKAEVMAPYLRNAAAAGRSQVAAIGVAQEFQRVWAAYQRDTKTAAPQYTFAKADRRVTCYYFYLWDEDFGPRSSRSARTSRIRPRSGSTGMSGPSGRPPRPGSATASCPTASRLATTRQPCRRSATRWARALSRCSPSGGCTGSRCPSARPISGPGTGERSPCARRAHRAFITSPRAGRSRPSLLLTPQISRKSSARHLASRTGSQPLRPLLSRQPPQRCSSVITVPHPRVPGSFDDHAAMTSLRARPCALAAAAPRKPPRHEGNQRDPQQRR